jgi:hypothetical protein
MIVWEESSGGVERELAAEQQLLADATARAEGTLSRTTSEIWRS